MKTKKKLKLKTLDEILEKNMKSPKFKTEFDKEVKRLNKKKKIYE